MQHYEVEPHLFVILGGTGDLTERKLLPALRRLARQDLLGEPRALLAVSRDEDLDDTSYRKWAQKQLEAHGFDDAKDLYDSRVFYQAMPDGDAEEYAALKQRIEEIEAEHDLPGNRLFYLALPPSVFPRAIEGLSKAGLAKAPGWTRLVIEKPFGKDLESAQALNEVVHKRFDEEQVYRIDHYLGKETVQNLLVFRFANAIFESVWNRDRIDNVQITVAEDLGIGDRAGYYDRSGALRDMVQNHVAQLVSLVGMEVPVAFNAEDVRYEKIKLLRSIGDIAPSDVVFGQYRTGEVGGTAVPGYRDEEDVPDGSRTETYVALRLCIDTWRWQGVPFYLRTGKRLKRRLTQIAVEFRSPPVCLFESLGRCPVTSNILYLTLQPDEGFALLVDVKVPGEPFELKTLPLDFFYRDAFGPVPDAYQTLLLDALTGDQTLFVHAEEAEASWAVFTRILEQPPAISEYAAGSWGPDAADQLLARDGRIWNKPVAHPAPSGASPAG